MPSATATASLRIDPSRAFAAFDEWARLMRVRGQSIERILRRLMRFWISIAIAKLKAQGTRTTAAKIEADLTRLSNGAVNWSGRARGARQQRLRGTIAAALVLALNWGGARTKRGKSGQSLFYGTVQRFINARKFSRNLHISGFYPAMSALKGTGDLGAIPRYSRGAPGSYSQSIGETVASLITANFASSAKRPGNTPAPLGISGLAPNILKEAESDMAALLEKWLREDLEAAAVKAGFRVSS